MGTSLTVSLSESRLLNNATTILFPRQLQETIMPITHDINLVNQIEGMGETGTLLRGRYWRVAA